MSTELKYLALTSLLTASLWIPYIVAQLITNGPLSARNYVDPTSRPVPFWGQRAHRADLLDRGGERAAQAPVIAVQLAGKNDGMTVFWATSFFWIRVAHAAVFLAAVPFIRTILFVLGWICVIGLFFELMK